MADWSYLPQALFCLIVQHLDSCFDLVHFRSVCSSWRSSTPPVSCHKSLRCPLPPDECGFVDDCYLSRSCVYLLRLPPVDNLRDPYGRCWLLKMREKEDGAMVLQNPFCSLWFCCSCNRLYRGLLLDSLKCQIVELKCNLMACYTSLVTSSVIPDRKVGKYVPVAFMRLGTENEDFAVLGVLSFDKLAMFRSMDKQWKQVENTRRFEAIATFNGKFYAVDYTGATIVVKPSSLEVSYFLNSRPPATTCRLVQSGNELFLVEVFSNVSKREDWYELDIEEEEATWVEVFKLDEDENECDMVQDLGDRVLFIAGNISFSCMASQIPGVRGGSILFFNGSCSFDDVLVFNLRDRSSRFMKNIPDYLKLFWPPPNRLFLDFLV